MSRSNALNDRAAPIDPPLGNAWHADLGTGLVRLAPRWMSDRVVVAAGTGLAALALDDGRVLWRHDYAAAITNIAGTSDAVLVSVLNPDKLLVCVSADGAELWRQSDWSVSQFGIAAAGNRFLVTGTHRDDGLPSCYIADAATGRIVGRFPCPSRAPDAVPDGFVFSVRDEDPDRAGLFHADVRTLVVERLLPHSHVTRAVSGSTVVINTTDIDLFPGELIAYDVAGRRPLWTERGGPSLTVAIDRGQVAAMEGIEQGRFVLVLRSLTNGSVHWKSEPFEGRTAAPLLVGDWAGAYVNTDVLHIFNRSNGSPIQAIEEPTMFSSGACVTPQGLVIADDATVRCLRHVD
jgi:PQQ-like domain